MRYFFRGIFFLFFLACFFASCFYRNEDDLYPCSSMNITYTRNIKPIIDARCIGCHNGSVNTSPVNFDFREFFVVRRVALSDSIHKAITGQFAGKPRMPYGGPYLTNCEITQIKTWVSLGAPF